MKKVEEGESGRRDGDWMMRVCWLWVVVYYAGVRRSTSSRRLS